MANSILPEDPHELAEMLVGGSPREWMEWQRRALSELGPVDGSNYWAKARSNYWARARSAAELLRGMNFEEE